ncbi:MAG: aromatic ring-hydroxylating dioxygenase subunit alpha [Acidimicrobiaceae bacterium]|nr:aromatic ring-hydroxylating dioxygenase subunit alpha [Acidimicrobiaceae bacterium]MCY4176407.1 aromatic ring-hydroxylating dioxygenase subunit alpha [Acidimicrobiaceae bacterium]MCY4280534.1 aromatic ring-hydroxylating dioxygenase subunit alpha [Acidimicrobiaceae bacterium]MCY4294275.1 aromatic ring-hydroxylating dioxygenase subunit alpha [Acidimicrobiaceae bacterium]
MSRAGDRVDHVDAETEDRIYESLRDKFWYPVAYSDELTDQPQSFVLCGKKLTVVRLGGEPVVFDDQCLHRGAALSLGRVVGDCLRCPYHGWTYDASGSVRGIPARDELAQHITVKLGSYPTCEVSGLVHTCLGDPIHPPPSVPEFDDPSYQFLHLDVYEWDCSMARRLENYFDFSHFPWVHDGILGDSSRPRVEDYAVERTGGELRFVAGPFPEFTDNVKNSPTADIADESVYGAMKRYRVFIPNAMQLNSSAGETEDYVLWVCLAPVGPERTRCFTYQGRNYGHGHDEDFMAFAQLVTDQDRPIVESQTPAQVPLKLPDEMFVKGADLALLEYRRWLLDLAGRLR